MSRAFILIFLLMVALPHAFAADDGFTRLLNSKSLRCTFGPGASASWKTGHPVVKTDKFDAVLQFDSIDPKAGKAHLIGNAGASDVIVLVTGNGLTFLEQTDYGNLSISTVFTDYAKGSQDFVAVHSRHMSGIGSPLPSQYHGTCKVWE